MSQTRTHSIYESLINILVGFWVGVGSQMLIFPMFDLHVEPRNNIIIACWFTVISFFRSLVLRRIFNYAEK